MSDLDDSLIEIAENIYNYGYRMGLARHGHSDQSADKTLEDSVVEIQKAFKDEGWSPDGYYDDKGRWHVDGNFVNKALRARQKMTGKQWLDLFNLELPNQKTKYAKSTVLNAAKRASGL